MTSKFETIPAGTLLTISTGCYSDYYVRGVFRACKDIDADALSKQWLTLHPEQSDGYRFREDDFLAWLAVSGYLEDVPSWEWHLSNYSRIDEMMVSRP